MLKVTIKDIEFDLCDLDTEYREALAHGLMELKYLSASPLELELGTERQQQELEKVYNMSLKPKQIKQIINFICEEMKGDFQYGKFSRIASNYINLANSIEKNKKSKERG
ncbi:MAG: hypothetical protein Q4E39_00795 [bacterium]|nr:hypothetical protein [bacterium]